MTWFLIVFLHGPPCPGKCDPIPAVTIAMPSQDVCGQIKKDNPDVALDCWGKPK
jgi:hypothetical protein